MAACNMNHCNWVYKIGYLKTHRRQIRILSLNSREFCHSNQVKTHSQFLSLFEGKKTDRNSLPVLRYWKISREYGQNSSNVHNDEPTIRSSND